MGKYRIMTVADYLSWPKEEERIAVLRHDVDKFPERAVRMALLEKNLNPRPKLQRGTTAPLILSPNPTSLLYKSKPLISPI